MSRERAKPGLTLGPVLMLIAAYFFWQMGNVAARALAPDDPGPRFWPMMLAMCLMAAGVVTTIQGIVARLRPSSPAGPPPGDDAAESKGAAETEAKRPATLRGWVRDWGVQNVALMLTLLPAYVFAVPWLGYGLSTWLLSTIVMTRLGEPSLAAALEQRSRTRKRPTSSWKAWLVTAGLASLVSLVLASLIIVMFDRVFRLPLPKSERLDLPF